MSSPVRTHSIGVFSEIILRGSGIEWDLKTTQPLYDSCDHLVSDIHIGLKGDSYGCSVDSLTITQFTVYLFELKIFVLNRGNE